MRSVRYGRYTGFDLDVDAEDLLKALSDKAYEGALGLLRPGEVEWTAAKLEEALAPYWAERLGKTAFVARQLSRRGATIKVAVAGDRIKLAGKGLTMMRGELTQIKTVV